MAESYPIDSSSDPQAEPFSQPAERLATLCVLSRRLKKSLNAVHRLKAQAYVEKKRTEEGGKTLESGQKGKTPLTGTGECRTYFVSEMHRKIEQDYFARYNVTSLSQLLEISSNILESYCRLLRKVDMEDDPDALLYPMGGVLEIALDAVTCAIELCDCQEQEISRN